MKGLRPDFPAGLQVLVVDGAELDGQLKELGYTATLCASAREAAEFLSRAQSPPDVLLAETRSVPLGNADSEWLLGQARAKNLPVVVMSGSGAAGEAMQFIEKGALDYLERPVSLPKLRNIWQHVVRKLMASDVHEKPMVYSKVQPQPQPLPLPLPVVQPAEKTGSVTDTLVAPSPSASVECGALSGLTSHSTKYISEAEASSCSENTKCRRVLRSVDTFAESSGKASASDGSVHGSAAAAAATKPSKLSRASSTTAPTRARSKRSAPALCSKSDAALAVQQPQQQPGVSAAPVAPVSPAALTVVQFPVAAAWQPGCVWGAAVAPMPMGWQVGMPASFMPVDSVPIAAAGGSESAANGAGKGAAAASPSPASLPSMASFASALSCNTELELPFPSAGDLSAMAVAAVSPSFGSSDTSLHSDFTDLMLPNDLDLDLMFGDGLDGLFGVQAAGCGGVAPPQADKPPIGLALRKSQSLVDLINAQLSAQAMAAAAEAAASGVAPMQCA